MKLTVYHLKTCDTCRKAIKALSAVGHELTLVDVRADGIAPDTLAQIMGIVGRDALLNTRSTTWRGLPDDVKTDIDNERALALMEAHPTLIKRPVLDTGDGVFVGWTQAVQDEFLDD